MTTLTTTLKPTTPLQKESASNQVKIHDPEFTDIEQPIGFIEDEEDRKQDKPQGISAVGSIDDFNSKTTSNQELLKNPILGSIKPGEWFDITNTAAKTIDFLGGTVSEVGGATSSLFKDEIFFNASTETPQKPDDSQAREQKMSSPDTSQPALYNPNKVIEDAIAAGPVQVAQQDLEKAIGIAERQITDSDPATLGLNSSLRKEKILDAYHGMRVYESDSDRQEALEKSQSENNLGGVQGAHKVSGQGLDQKKSLNDNLSNETQSTAQRQVG